MQIKNNLFNQVYDQLRSFNLPTSLKSSDIPISKVKIQNEIYKNIFLDKKRIDKSPRYISMKIKVNLQYKI